MFMLCVLFIAAISLVAYTARTASERGRHGVRWAVLSVVAGVCGQLAGMVLFGRTLQTTGTTDSSVGVLGAYVASTLGPLGCMLGVFGLLTLRPDRVPQVGGRRWPVYRMSSGDTPGFDCLLSVENGLLQLGSQPPIQASTITELAADGECLRLSWSGQSVLLMPAGKSLSPRERAKQSLGLANRLRALLNQTSLPPA